MEAHYGSEGWGFESLPARWISAGQRGCGPNCFTSRSPLGRDPITGKRVQITKGGYRTAAEAGRARRGACGGL
ncbi:MAG: Arm DNA-binding domain-containing protein [Acidimicrobiales bacterium]